MLKRKYLWNAGIVQEYKVKKIEELLVCGALGDYIRGRKCHHWTPYHDQKEKKKNSTTSRVKQSGPLIP